MFSYDRHGIKLEGVDFWLDARRTVPFSFISHGHSDHLKNHGTVLATPATLLFHAMRAKQKKTVALEYHQKLVLGSHTVELFPAGHVLGSAMIRIERNGESLLYTGDFKLKRGRTAEPIRIPQADVLIMESTFGDPHFRFSSAEYEPEAELIAFVEACFRKNELPVVLAYGLGKAQEAMKILGDAGYDVTVHRDAWKIADVYRQFGIEFDNCSLWQGHEPPRELQVLIIPPHSIQFRRIKALPARRRTVLLSGWALAAGGNRFGCDHCIPLSDHADFDELIEFVRCVQPNKIFTLHGMPAFAQWLRELGYDAEYLPDRD